MSNKPVNLHVATLLPLCVLAVFPGTLTAGNQDIVTVVAGNGRAIRGTVDPKTDDNTLWLRDTAPKIVMQSGIHWDEILEVQHAGESISVEKLRMLVPDLKRPLPQDFFSPKDWDVPPGPVVPPDSVELPAPGGGYREVVNAGQVQSLNITATVANWDRDVEPDGLLVTVMPLNAVGEVIPINGRIELTLIGETLSPRVEDRFWPREAFPELDRWSVPFRDSDVTPYGAVLRVPFRNLKPDRDFGIATMGLVTARLNVPGQGTFGASYAHVNFRPHSYIRDALELRSNRRYFQQEWTRFE